MSTRGVIAVTHGDSWLGVYLGSDAYPSWSGTRLWKVFSQQYGGDLALFEREVIRTHPGGYHSADDQCYCHDPADPRPTDAAFYTPEDEDFEALHIEWLYIFGRHALTIYTSVRALGYHTCTRDDGYSWQSPNYRWALVTQVALAGAEPDWQAIEALGETRRDEAEAAQAPSQE